MFSGIVEKLGSVREIQEQPPGVRLTLEVGPMAKEVTIGESVAINGCCLTAIESGPDRLVFEAGEENGFRYGGARLTRDPKAQKVDLDQGFTEVRTEDGARFLRSREACTSCLSTSAAASA